MTDAPPGWFDALRVDPDDVARVGYSLAEYALEHEGDAAVSEEERGDLVELRLMRAATLADAASLLVLVDVDAALRLFAESAALLERMDAPEVWTLGLACRGVWEPSESVARRGGLARPSDGIASLAALFYQQESERGNPHSGWEWASGFGDNPSHGWTATGVPARLLADFARRARDHDVDGTLEALDRVVRRADETIQARPAAGQLPLASLRSRHPIG